MINVLERKGVLTSKEVLDELEVITATQGKKEGKCDSNDLRLMIKNMRK